MKNINSLLLVPCAFLLSIMSTTIAAEDYKLGAVNAIRVLEKSPQAENARKLIEQEFAPRDKKLVAAQKKLKEIEDKLSKDSAIMSESERKKMERGFINKKRELKRNQDEFREDFNFRRNEEFAKIQKQIVEAIQKVAKENNYDAVMLSDSIIYASPKMDISDMVIEYLKKQHSGSAEP